jgi:hypothetical protein
MTSWQLIFLQSKVNNGAYDGDRYFARFGFGLRRLGFNYGSMVIGKAIEDAQRKLAIGLVIRVMR